MTTLSRVGGVTDAAAAAGLSAEHTETEPHARELGKSAVLPSKQEGPPCRGLPKLPPAAPPSTSYDTPRGPHGNRSGGGQ
jgi:hypothetical protein